ncbi:helix-turn-helix domain-containing protein [Kitasatospora viridis]|uniref:helix-turn-helix domain-containing protein n=1 Tax=Kitasatospora viridis TaxID=281105 RepID=UPI0031D75B75
MLEQTVYHSSDLPAEDRFDFWRQLVGRTHAPLDVLTKDPADFRATQRVLHLDGVTVWPTTFTPALFRRTTRLIRASDPETVHLTLPLSGPLETTRGDLQVVYPANTLSVISSSHPVDVWAGREPHLHSGIGLEVPRSRLILPRDGVERLITRPLSTETGYGALLAQLLHQVIRDRDTYQPSDGARLGGVVVDLVSALFAATLEHDPSTSTGPAALLLRIKAFISTHLHDPDLTPTTVAAAHHISVSYLHRLFQQDGTSVAAWIRARRLERARRDLTDPISADLPVHAVAARWGFRHAADFNRAFKAAYGRPPGEFRQEVRKLLFFAQAPDSDAGGT